MKGRELGEPQIIEGNGSSCLVLVSAGFALLSTLAAAEPIPDSVLYGRIYDPVSRQAINSTLPGPVVVKAGDGPSAVELARCNSLTEFASDSKSYYIVRIPRRSEGGATENSGKSALAGDRLHIFIDLNGNQAIEPDEEVSETRVGQLIVTDQTRDVLRFDLNRPMEDADADGLPDDWERFYFGNLSSGPLSQPAGDGVDNLLALAMGVDPKSPKAHLLPFLKVEANGGLSYYFRLSSAPTNTIVRVESSGSPAGPWLPAEGTAEQVGNWTGGKLFRLPVPNGGTPSRRFFRLAVSPEVPPPP